MDPEIRLQQLLDREMRREIGPNPTAEEENAYWERRNRKAEAELREVEQRQREERALEQQRELARRQVLDERWRSRDTPASGYEPARDLDSLREHVAGKRSFCERSVIVGSPEKNIELPLDLECINFRDSTFRNVTFTCDAKFAFTRLSGSTFEDVIFAAGADFREADFSDTELRNVRFEKGCKLTGASFRFAKFRGRVDVEFDRNYIASATFDEVRRDDWARMSAAFAGIWQYINLTAGGAYFGLLLLKLYLFDAAIGVQSALASVWPKITEVGSVKISAFEFVFGSGVLSVATAAVIFLYQAMRIVLTTRIGPLIESEKRSGYTPDRSSYAPYVVPRRVMGILGAMALSLFVYEVWDLWTPEVLSIPAKIAR